MHRVDGENSHKVRLRATCSPCITDSNAEKCRSPRSACSHIRTGCSRTKIPRHKAGEAGTLPTGEWPFDVTSADAYKTGWPAPDGSEDILSFACHLTRAIIAEATRTAPTAEIVADLLLRLVIRYFGCPRILFSDSGSVFVAAANRYLYKRYGIGFMASSAYHHQFIGLVERWHSVLKQLLRAHRASAPDLDWTKSLPLLVLAFNSVVNQCTKVAPSFAIHHRDVRLPADLIHNAPSSPPKDLPTWVSEMLDAAHISYNALSQTLRLNTLANKKKFDLRRDVSLAYRVGDKVLVVRGPYVDGNLPKAEIPTSGPYTVSKVLANNNYILSGDNARRFRTPIHVERLLPYLEERSDEAATRSSVECIVDHRSRPAADPSEPPIFEYRVRWLGYGKSYDRWLTSEYLSDIPHIVGAYQRTHDLSQHGVQPPLLPQPPVLALPAPQVEAQGRRHFRSRTGTAAEPAALPPTPPTLVAPPPLPAITDAGPPSPVPLMMPADSPEPPLALSPPSPLQLGAVPYPAKDEDPTPDDSDLPFEAKLVNGKWSYGAKKPTKRGHVVRWFAEQHFLPLELESEHFELLRRSAKSTN